MNIEYLPLSRPYVSVRGRPIVERVEAHVFLETYYQDCFNCHFCHDACCQFGATTEADKVEKILAAADELEPLVGYPKELWFEDWREPNDDYTGGAYTRSRVEDGACVFLNRQGRGCLLHQHALNKGEPVQDWKPAICQLFPILFDEGTLIVPSEIEDRSLVCVGTGPTLYQAARADLEEYFGPELVAELDELERQVLARQPLRRPRSRTPLPVIAVWRGAVPA